MGEEEQNILDELDRLGESGMELELVNRQILDSALMEIVLLDGEFLIT